MDRNYWERIAPGYNEEIFDVLQNDEKRLILKAIKKIASSKKTVLDAGCAIGKWLPVLSPYFKKVVAADISQKNLDIAKDTYPLLKNIEYLRVDLSAPTASRRKFDSCICINAILTDSLKKRQGFFKNLGRWLNKGGDLVLVVPSLESWLLTNIIQQQFHIDKAIFDQSITGRQAMEKYSNIKQGNADIDNVPTKHYLAEELQLLLANENLELTQLEKIEYSWKTEFLRPPSWLTEPRPWDWLVVARKLQG
jgi:2-polyprenyl-3-methyl-5-hydroxy-6-metoxy-1,4-benzoquinol methylase